MSGMSRLTRAARDGPATMLLVATLRTVLEHDKPDKLIPVRVQVRPVPARLAARVGVGALLFGAGAHRAVIRSGTATRVAVPPGP
jgi:hypothetical protein